MATYRYKEYHWESAGNESHEYLLGSLTDSLRRLNIDSSARILDAGCGGGNLLHKIHSSGFRNIWGFDMSRSGINVCKENFPDLSGRFYVHDAYEKELPGDLRESQFDVVISVEVIEHMYDPEQYLRNVNSWLANNGYLIITTPYHGYLKNIAIALTNGFDRHVHPSVAGGHIKFFSKSTLYGLLDDTGFEPVDFRGSGRLPYLWKSMVVTSMKSADS